MRFFALLRGILIVAFVSVASFASAEGITIRNASVEPFDDGWQLQADFDVQFSPRLEEAVNRGVPLYFIVEFELSRPRWYWLDEKPVLNPTNDADPARVARLPEARGPGQPSSASAPGRCSHWR